MTLLAVRRFFGFGAKSPKRPSPLPTYRLLLEILEERQVPSTLHVGSHEPYHTIQAAVNAANPNDTIKVDAGTYQEQVVIGPGKNGIKLEGDNQAAIIEAPPTTTSTKTIVEVNGAQNVTIDGFTITGPGGAADSLEFGIQIDGGGSATITDNHITKVEDATFNGAQHGVAIQVGRSLTSQTGSATISDNTIDNYQKGGITVDNTGSSAQIDNNVVKGAGSTGVIAQNGIQISNGATARVDHNHVTGNVYTGTTAAAGGIVLNQSGTVRVDHNTVANNDIDIWAIGVTGVEIDDNKCTGATYNGIYLDSTTASQVTNNKTDHNGTNNAGDGGIALTNSTGNTIDQNDSDKNQGDGIYLDEGSTGNTLNHNCMTHNTNLDAEDLSTGTGTSGTGNTWKHNNGKTSSPGGLVS
jgi:parallel beta-helix repeat protein